MKWFGFKCYTGLTLAAMMLALGCSGGLQQNAALPGTPSSAVEPATEARLIDLKGDVAFFSCESLDGNISRMGIKNNNQSMAIYSSYQVVKDESWEQAAISRQGYVIQIGGRGSEGIDYRIGKVHSDQTDVEWIRRGKVTTIPVYLDDYDVAMDDNNHVVFVWSSNNWSNAYYSSAVINEDSGTGLNWNQNNVQFYAAGGLFHNLRISFMTDGGGYLGIVYKPSDASLRYVGCGLYEPDGSIYWFLDRPTALTGRSAGDGIYDIAMDENRGFSLAWVSNQGKHHYAYHRSGTFCGYYMAVDGVQTEITSAKDSGPWKYQYYDVEVGRSKDGGSILMTIPQSNQPFQASLGTFSATSDAKGNLTNRHTDGRNVGTTEAGTFWANNPERSWAHLAY